MSVLVRMIEIRVRRQKMRLQALSFSFGGHWGVVERLRDQSYTFTTTLLATNCRLLLKESTITYTHLKDTCVHERPRIGMLQCLGITTLYKPATWQEILHPVETFHLGVRASWSLGVVGGSKWTWSSWFLINSGKYVSIYRSKRSTACLFIRLQVAETIWSRYYNSY